MGLRNMGCSLLWVSAKLRRKKFLCKSSRFEQVLRRHSNVLLGNSFVFQNECGSDASPLQGWVWVEGLKHGLQVWG